MNMTRFGKILVFVNLALSIIFATWALGVYGNHIDWGKGPEKPGVAKGKMAVAEDQLKEATAQLQTAMARYNKAAVDLPQAEKQRLENQKYYAAELHKLETGLDEQGNRVQNPVMELVYDKGQLSVDQKTGRPLLRAIPWPHPQQPLLDLAHLGQEFETTSAQILKEKQGLDELVKQEQAETEKLNGDGKTRKGLRRQMDDVQEALVRSLGEKEFLRRMEKAAINVTVPASQGVEGEQEWLMPLLYNRKAELDIVLRRQRRLENRLQEIKQAKDGRKAE